jgi:hypothetical protein
LELWFRPALRASNKAHKSDSTALPTTNFSSSLSLHALYELFGWWFLRLINRLMLFCYDRKTLTRRTKRWCEEAAACMHRRGRGTARQRGAIATSFFLRSRQFQQALTFFPLVKHSLYIPCWCMHCVPPAVLLVIPKSFDTFSSKMWP